MRKFKIGDKVVVHKPRNVESYPFWCREMDKYDGVVTTVSSFHQAGPYQLRGISWNFSGSWLTPFDDEEFEGNV